MDELSLAGAGLSIEKAELAPDRREEIINEQSGFASGAKSGDEGLKFFGETGEGGVKAGGEDVEIVAINFGEPVRALDGENDDIGRKA